jgi:hypothetical protein
LMHNDAPQFRATYCLNGQACSQDQMHNNLAQHRVSEHELS